MIRVGLTGGIGSGKTTVAKFFELLEIPIYYSDIEAKKLMLTSEIIKKKLIHLLGDDTYSAEGELNKAYISKKIFSNSILLNKINKIVHPVVEDDFSQFCKQYSNKKYIIIESAILVEIGWFKTLDKLILVTANQQERVNRILKRDQSSEAEILAKISKQMSDSEKKVFADYRIENNNNIFLIPQVLNIHAQLSSL